MQAWGFGGETQEGQFFFGCYASGKRDGYGLLKKTDGSAWMGRYDNGMMCEGLWIYGDGSFKMTGRSGGGIEESEILKVIQYRYGDSYYGEVKDGKPDGYGQYYSPKQEYFYVGEFADGKRSGRGACYIVDAPDTISLMAGTWNDGGFSGQGILAEDPEAGFEEGEWIQEAGRNSAARLADGSWFYRNEVRPRGVHIYYRSDGSWYYGEPGRPASSGYQSG